MTLTLKSGPWSSERVESWLRDTVIPLRIASAGKHGPLVQSLWFVYERQALFCATQRSSVLAKRLERDGRVGWEVSGDEPPYRGVRGTGDAELIDDVVEVSQVLNSLIGRYGQDHTELAQWLLGRIESEVAVRITNLRVSSWDYSPRMSG